MENFKSNGKIAAILRNLESYEPAICPVRAYPAHSLLLGA